LLEEGRLVNVKNILILVGGTYHDFNGFASTMQPALEAAGHSVETTYELDSVTCLKGSRYDLVLLYTCLGTAPEGTPVPDVHSDAQVRALTEWVQGGGALLGAHAATVAAKVSPEFKHLLGGVFVEHPPAFSFTVYPVYGQHPITTGIEAFTVHDEFYMELHEPDVEVHMVALDRGVAYPMVWSRREGKGRVVHIAMGHDEMVWDLQPYQRLMLQAIDWLTT
jgi:type 1 glutamine amidotransferase